MMAFQLKRPPTKRAFSSIQGRQFGSCPYGRNPQTNVTAGPRGCERFPVRRAAAWGALGEAGRTRARRPGLSEVWETDHLLAHSDPGLRAGTR